MAVTCRRRRPCSVAGVPLTDVGTERHFGREGSIQERSKLRPRPMFASDLSQSSFLYPKRSYTMLTYLKAWMTTHLPKDEKGQDAAEYAILIGLIALVIVAAVILLGNNISATFAAVAAAFPLP